MAEALQRSSYTTRQVDEYFQRISLPQDASKRLTDCGQTKEQELLALLEALQKHQIATVPFENLSLHYSPHRTISLDPDVLFDKIVRKKRGGYCMENNRFFGTVLRSLGYSVYSAGARVSDNVSGRGQGGYGSWYFCILVV